MGVTPSSYLPEQPVSEGLQLENLNGIEIKRIQTRQDWIVVKPCCLKSRRAASLVSRGERPRKAGHYATRNSDVELIVRALSQLSRSAGR